MVPEKRERERESELETQKMHSHNTCHFFRSGWEESLAEEESERAKMVGERERGM